MALRIQRDVEIEELYNHWAEASKDQVQDKEKKPEGNAGYEAMVIALGGPDIARRIYKKRLAQELIASGVKIG